LCSGNWKLAGALEGAATSTGAFRAGGLLGVDAMKRRSPFAQALSIARHAAFLTGYSLLTIFVLLWAQYAPHRDEYELVEFQGRLERMLVHAGRPENKDFIILFALPIAALVVFYGWLIARLSGWQRRIMATTFLLSLGLAAVLRFKTL